MGDTKHRHQDPISGHLRDHERHERHRAGQEHTTNMSMAESMEPESEDTDGNEHQEQKGTSDESPVLHRLFACGHGLVVALDLGPSRANLWVATRARVNAATRISRMTIIGVPSTRF